jgi:acyl-CoA thioester hydrolase
MAADVDALLENFPVRVRVPVAWGEMDAFGHVNNVVYFRYFENARIEYLRLIDFADASAVGPILASTHCRFRRPVTYPDQLQVGVRTTEISADRFTIEYRLVSERLGEVAAEGGGVVVSYDYVAGRKAPIPAAVRRAIETLEQEVGRTVPDQHHT